MGFYHIFFHYKDIPRSFLGMPLNDASVDLISQRTGKAYKQLAVELGVNNSVIEGTVIENTKDVERSRAFLKEWMSRKGITEATLGEIGKAMVEVGMDVSVVKECIDY